MDSDYNFFDNAPVAFALCFNTGCASAGACLRGLAARHLNDSRPSVTAVNPLLADAGGAAVCRFFRSADKVRIAYGFRNALAGVPAGRVRDVRAAICQLVCQRNYYYLLRGEKPMMPDMQESIAAVLQQNGLPAPVEFDRYEWHYEW